MYEFNFSVNGVHDKINEGPSRVICTHDINTRVDQILIISRAFRILTNLTWKNFLILLVIIWYDYTDVL